MPAKKSEFTDFTVDDEPTADLVALARSKAGRAPPVPKSRKRPERVGGKASAKDKSKAKVAFSSVGLVTRGVGAGLRGIEAAAGRVRRLGLFGCVAAMSAFAVVVLTMLAAAKSPTPARLDAVSFAGVPAPKALKERWVTEFSGFEDLFLNPSPETLVEFGAHLEARPEVARVDDLQLRWQRMQNGKLQRVAAVTLTLRDPLMPLLTASHTRAWIDAEGMVLPGELAGPSGEPEVQNLERGGRESLLEILSVWPELRRRLPPGFIKAIDLHAQLSKREQRGIVLIAGNGTRIEWGQAGEGKYGVTPAHKVRNLIHAIQHFDNVSSINLRFPDPVAMVR